MCLSRPGLVLKYEGGIAEVDSAGGTGWYIMLVQPDISRVTVS